MTQEARYGCRIDDGTVYVDADIGSLEIGPVSDLLKHFGETHEITYRDWEKERYDVSFADEGLEIDVLETVETMTLSETEVDWLADKSLEPTSDDAYFSTGRMPLFTGFLDYILDHGPA